MQSNAEPGSKLSEQLGIERIEIATAESDEGVETSVSSLLLLLPLLATLTILPRGVSCEKERDRDRDRERGREIERQRERGERVGLHIDDTQALRNIT